MRSPSPVALLTALALLALPACGPDDASGPRAADRSTADRPDGDRTGGGRSSGDRVVPTDEAAAPVTENALGLVLPTSNRAVFEGEPEDFYMGVNVTVDSLREERWEGGQYGYVRDPVPTVFGRRTFRRVHEGVDIRPVGRDAAGEPTDTVSAIAAGRVVYVNPSAGGSSYGVYVVVEHEWSGSPVYSLYAHLREAVVAEGDALRAGQALGVMGYTGRGLGRARAHVHLEVALMVNRHMQHWFDAYIGSVNAHGNFFGTNLAGVPPVELYEAVRRDPDLTFPAFVASLDEGYEVDLPGGRPLDLLTRYPWLGPEAAAADPAEVPAWRVAFTQEGVPVRVEVAPEAVDRPEVEGVALGVWLTDGSTNRMLRRRGLRYEPARRGLSYFALLATTADGAPRW